MTKKRVAQAKPPLGAAFKEQCQQAIEAYIETVRLAAARKPRPPRGRMYQEAYDQFRTRFDAAAFAAFVDLVMY